MGTREDCGDGRVSSAIVELDMKARRVRTESGRVYMLHGPPGYSSNGEYVWSSYKIVNGIKEVSKDEPRNQE